MGTEETKRKYEYAKKHYKVLPLSIKKAEYDAWKEYAESVGEPLSTMIQRVMREYIDTHRDHC